MVHIYSLFFEDLARSYFFLFYIDFHTTFTSIIAGCFQYYTKECDEYLLQVICAGSSSSWRILQAELMQ